jgi:hypothetical protein
MNEKFKKIYDKIYQIGFGYIKTDNPTELEQCIKYCKLFALRKKDGYYFVVTRERYYSK